MSKNYEYILQIAESILDDARFTKERIDYNNIKLYYNLYDEIGELELTKEDIDLFRTRLDSILGDCFE